MKTNKSETNFRCTTREMSEKLKIDYAVAAALLTSLTALGVVAHVGEQKNSSGRGMPSKIYEVPTSFTVEFE